MCASCGQVSHRSHNTDRRIILGEAAAPKARYTRRGARDIALSMIIRHVNSIIRSTSSPCDLSRDPSAWEIHDFYARRHVRLEVCDLRGNRDGRSSRGKESLPSRDPREDNNGVIIMKLQLSSLQPHKRETHLESRKCFLLLSISLSLFPCSCFVKSVRSCCENER